MKEDEILDLDVEGEYTEEKEDEIDVEKVKLELVKLLSLFEEKRTLSQLTHRERFWLSKLELLRRPFHRLNYESRSLTEYINAYLLYGVSLDRKGREEMVKLASSFYAGLTEEENVGMEAEQIRRLLLNR